MKKKKLTHSSISTLLQQISLFPNHVAIDLVRASTSFPPQPKEKQKIHPVNYCQEVLAAFKNKVIR